MDTSPAPLPRYFRPAGVEGAEHIRLFHCEALHADLSAEACARRHARQDDYPCHSCRIGVLHADRLGIHVARDKTRAAHTRPCCRCGRHEFRLIGARLCPSCWNREREWILGQNRKGGKPTIPLRTWEALVAALDGLGTRQRQLSGIAVRGLGAREYSMRMAALNEAEVERVIGSIWPGAEIVAIGSAAQPEAAGDQRRISARQVERMPGSEIA